MVDIEKICSGVYRGDYGIWYSDEKTKISYSDGGNRNCYSVEDRSFWFKHRNKCILELIKTFPPKNRGPIFDIGGGNGYVSSYIIDNGFKAVLVEPGFVGVHNAKKRGLEHIICACFQDINFKPGSLPSVGLFDLLEHIEDDSAFLSSLKSLLIPGGRLYISVPAHPFLWSKNDSIAGHYRRYTTESLSRKLTAVGFQLDFSTYIFRLLPLPIFLLRTIPSRLGLSRNDVNKRYVHRDHGVNNYLFGRLIALALSSEIDNLRSKTAMMFGASCLLVATNL